MSGHTHSTPVVTGLDTADSTVCVGVIDDDPAIREAIRETCFALGCRYLEAADRASGVALIEQAKNIDLLILDYEMPGKNTKGLASLARAKHTSITILGCSGNPDGVEELRQDGCDVLHQKPLRNGALTSFIMRGACARSVAA